MKTDRPFIIWTPSFNAKIGGVIVLHYLCHLLNELGYRAYLWPSARRSSYKVTSVSDFPIIEKGQRLLREAGYRMNRDTFFVNPSFETPIATPDDIKNAIVVYPEIVSGNPIGGKHVVRWLLNKPGFFTGKFEYGKNDLFFLYQEFFNDKSLNVDSENILRVKWIRDDIYKVTNLGARHGSCVMIRKGLDRKDYTIYEFLHRIDWYTHKKISNIFNVKKIFLFL